MTFCNDIDLLHWEPNVFRDAVFASQLLMAGTGNLAGTSFTISGASFVDNHVKANGVIVLSGSVAGSFPILSVDSATELMLSAMYDGLADDPPEPSAVGTASGLSFAVRTFWPQRKVVSDLIVRAGGIEPEDPSISIVNADALWRACVLGTLQMIYNALAAASSDPSDLSIRADLYERLYRRALHQSRIEVDTNGDGVADMVRHLGVLRFQRA